MESALGVMGCLLRKHSPLRSGERGSPAIDPNVGGVLTIYTTAGGNLVQKHKTIRFAVVGERAATKYPQISVTGSPQITAQFSEASQMEMREPFVFPTEISCLRAARISWFFHVNCKLVASKTTIFFSYL